jgi:hypothetical protein
MKLAEICRHSPLLHHGTQTAIQLSKATHEHISAIYFFLAAIVTIAVVLAIAEWPNDGNPLSRDLFLVQPAREQATARSAN